MTPPERDERARPSPRSPAERLRLLLLFVGLGLLIGMSRPRPLPAVVGAVLLLAGESIRIWASGHLLKTDELITSGPYGYCRNPLYLGRLLLFSGLALLAWLPYGLSAAVLVLGFGVFFLYYMPRKERIEPARLAERHGDDYRRYRSEVPSLLPRSSRWPEASRNRWSARRLSRSRETLTALALLVIAGWLLLRAFFSAPAA